jgi:hypothetical protein
VEQSTGSCDRSWIEDDGNPPRTFTPRLEMFDIFDVFCTRTVLEIINHHHIYTINGWYQDA